jgi:Bifunctional DNA primase/polymerase, N-terminal/ParB-like nuclease domain
MIGIARPIPDRFEARARSRREEGDEEIVKKRKMSAAATKLRMRTGKNKKSSGTGSALRVALRLAAEDAPLLPRCGKVDGRCSCGNENCERPGRHSPSGISTADATTDPQVIRRWWKKWPDAWPGIVIGGELGIIAVVSEGAAGEATERKLREQGKIFKKTITFRDHQRRIRLCYAWGSDVPYGTQLGDGLRLLDAGEIVKAPRRLQGGDSIQFLDGRAPGEISLTSAPDWLPELTKRVHERLPNDEAKLNVRPPAEPRQLDPRFEYGEVRVEDVLTRPDHDELDDDVVSAIAESQGGPFTPIMVRRIPPEEQRKPSGHEVELIRGKQRLEAARLRGMERIRCMFFSGTETAAQIIGIEEDLFRKDSTVLRRAERLVNGLTCFRKRGTKFTVKLSGKNAVAPRPGSREPCDSCQPLAARLTRAARSSSVREKLRLSRPRQRTLPEPAASTITRQPSKQSHALAGARLRLRRQKSWPAGCKRRRSRRSNPQPLALPSANTNGTARRKARPCGPILSGKRKHLLTTMVPTINLPACSYRKIQRSTSSTVPGSGGAVRSFGNMHQWLCEGTLATCSAARLTRPRAM